MKTFNDLVFQPYSGWLGANGVKSEIAFPNGFGVSVVRHDGSYGGESGLYELAVLKGSKICYDTPVTGDVEGWLTPDKVTELMQQVQELPDA